MCTWSLEAIEAGNSRCLYVPTRASYPGSLVNVCWQEIQQTGFIEKEGWHNLLSKYVAFLRAKLRNACSPFDAKSINALVPMYDTFTENITVGAEERDST